MNDDLPRNCKDCSTPIGKGQQACVDCKLKRRRKAGRERKQAKSNRAKGILPTWEANFRRDKDGTVKEKRCCACDQWKSAQDFSIRNDTASGMTSHCKPCLTQRNKERHAERPKSIPIIHRGQNCRNCGIMFDGYKRSFCSRLCAKQSSTQVQRIKSQSIHVISSLKCRKCGQIKALDAFQEKGMKFKIKPSRCRDCKKQTKRHHSRLASKLPRNRARRNLSNRFHKIMATTKKGGDIHLRSMIGCSTAFLRSHLQSQFKRGMKWANYGKAWHIDHIQPVSSFDHNDPTQVKACWHYSNLRPLKALENILKSNDEITHQPELLLQVA